MITSITSFMAVYEAVLMAVLLNGTNGRLGRKISCRERITLGVVKENKVGNPLFLHQFNSIHKSL